MTKSFVSKCAIIISVLLISSVVHAKEGERRQPDNFHQNVQNVRGVGIGAIGVGIVAAVVKGGAVARCVSVENNQSRRQLPVKPPRALEPPDNILALVLPALGFQTIQERFELVEPAALGGHIDEG